MPAKECSLAYEPSARSLVGVKGVNFVMDLGDGRFVHPNRKVSTPGSIPERGPRKTAQHFFLGKLA
jgi:hypothetical protein